jgi:hypothetical protein
MEGLLQADYRVRRAIRQCLEDQRLKLEERSEGTKAVFADLALCYRIGFGGHRDDAMARSLMKNIKRPLHSLEYMLSQLNDMAYTPQESRNTGNLFRDLEERGLLSELLLVDSSLEHGKIIEAIQILSGEIRAIEHFVGTENPLWLFHARKLIYFYRMQQNSTATNFNRQALQSLESKLSRTIEGIAAQDKRIGKPSLPRMHIDEAKRTDEGKLRRVKGVARFRVTQRGGQVDDAIERSLQKLEDRPWLITRGDQSLASLMYELTMFPARAGHPDAKSREAEALGREIRAILRGKQGYRERSTLHPAFNLYRRKKEIMQTYGDLDLSILAEVRCLALTLKAADDWESAEELETRVLSTLRNVCEVDHPTIVSSMINLGRTYRHLGLDMHSLELFIELREELQAKRGDADPATLESTKILSGVYRLQARPEEARKLLRLVQETRQRARGVQDAQETVIKPSLASRIATLLRVWRNQSSLNTLEPAGKGLEKKSEITKTSEEQAANTANDQNEFDFGLVYIPGEDLMRQIDENGRSLWVDHNTGGMFEQPVPSGALYLVPAGWEYRKDATGQIYWVNPTLRMSSWTQPDYVPRGWEARQDEAGQTYWLDMVTHATTYERPSYIPGGWEERIDHLDRLYYLDHGTKTKQWKLPRAMDIFEPLPYDYEDRRDPQGRLFWVDPMRLEEEESEGVLPPISEPIDPPTGPVKHRFAR